MSLGLPAGMSTASATVWAEPSIAGLSDSVTIPGSSIGFEDSASNLWHVYTELASRAAQRAKKQNDGTQPPSCPNNGHQEGALFDGGKCPLNSRPLYWVEARDRKKDVGP